MNLNQNNSVASSLCVTFAILFLLPAVLAGQDPKQKTPQYSDTITPVVELTDAITNQNIPDMKSYVMSRIKQAAMEMTAAPDFADKKLLLKMLNTSAYDLTNVTDGDMRKLLSGMRQDLKSTQTGVEVRLQHVNLNGSAYHDMDEIGNAQMVGQNKELVNRLFTGTDRRALMMYGVSVGYFKIRETWEAQQKQSR